MITVALLFREKRPNGFSIEEIFKTIERELAQQVVFKKFYVNKSKSKFWNIKAVAKIKADVYHITGDCNYLALGIPPEKTILTVHDIGHYENTLSGLKKWLYGLFWFKWPLQKAHHITCISNFTKSKLIEYFKIDAAKINVIYNPYPALFKANLKTFRTKTPIILQIGAGHNKNTARLIEAIKGLDCKLLLINGLNENIEKQLKQNQISYISKSKLSFDEVYEAYCFADIVFFASTYEGFGLPIVEANATGRVIITSTVASMPEIAGDSAYLVNPLSVEEIRTALQNIIENADLRSQLIKNGFENIKRFESYEIANQYFQLYCKVAQK
ncbi:MAG: glycosyltransferase family 1 protein [Bacteroidota bacterium]